VSRLRHSASGFLRLIQISGANVAVITEGRIDRLFFGSLSKEALRTRHHISLTIRSVRELPDMDIAGGKNAVRSYFEFLRRRASLTTRLGGKTSLIVFCLDKDLDDLTRRRIRSPHVIYTELFDVESYLFKFGDLCTASSVATSIDLGTIERAIAPASEWLTRVTESWRDWVAICVFEITGSHVATGNYGRCPSPVHDSSGSVVPEKLARCLTNLQTRTGLPAVEFQQQWGKNCRRVARYYRRGLADKIFKGKWYSWLLLRDLKRLFADRDVDWSGLRDQLSNHLFHTLDFRTQWAAPLIEKFSSLFDRELPAPI
jgi:hypothetical protein